MAAYPQGDATSSLIPRQEMLLRRINSAPALLFANSIQWLHPVVDLCLASHGLFDALLEFRQFLVADATQAEAWGLYSYNYREASCVFG